MEYKKFPEMKYNKHVQKYYRITKQLLFNISTSIHSNKTAILCVALLQFTDYMKCHSNSPTQSSEREKIYV